MGIPMFNINTGKLVSKSGKIACTCCSPFTPQYSEDDCCCFLNPTPETWNDPIPKTYALHECVSYDGFTWYSLQADNLNHTPTVGGGWWAKYTHCDNANWNEVPQYAGIGKTPLYYALSVSITGSSYVRVTKRTGPAPTCDYETYYTENYDCTLHAYGKAEKSSDCIWSLSSATGGDLKIDGHYSQSFACGSMSPCTSWSYDEDFQVLPGDGKPTMSITLKLTPDHKIEVSILVPFRTGDESLTWVSWRTVIECITEVSEDLTFDVCDIKGTVSDSGSVSGWPSIEDCWALFAQWCENTWSITASWVPLDCEYTIYNEETVYATGACCAYGGKFWRCCITNGPGTAVGVQPPSGSETLCTGSNYWRVVV